MRRFSTMWHQVVGSIVSLCALGLASPSSGQQRVSLADLAQQLDGMSQRLSAIEQSLKNAGAPAPSNPLDATV